MVASERIASERVASREGYIDGGLHRGRVALYNTKVVPERVASGSTISKGGYEMVTWSTPTLSTSNQKGPHSHLRVQTSAVAESPRALA